MGGEIGAEQHAVPLRLKDLCTCFVCVLGSRARVERGGGDSLFHFTPFTMRISFMKHVHDFYCEILQRHQKNSISNPRNLSLGQEWQCCAWVGFVTAGLVQDTHLGMASVWGPVAGGDREK